jgi:hypothetical protein
MATDFSAISAAAQAAGTVNAAVAGLLAGIAALPALTNSTDAAVVTFAADLAAQADNLARACAHNGDGSMKPAGGDEREPYLAAVGL